MTNIYILKHPKSGFNGYVHGVAFSNGRGSTNSKHDVDFCVSKGCKDITGGDKPDAVKKESKEKTKKATKSKAEEEK